MDIESLKHGVAVLRVLDEWNSGYAPPKVGAAPRPQVYDLETDWPDRKYPGAGGPGVYFVFRHDGALLYIGQVSFRHTIGYRFGQYFGYEKSTKKCRIKRADFKERGARYVAVIPLESGHCFLAPALEQFSLQRLEPPLNRNRPFPRDGDGGRDPGDVRENRGLQGTPAAAHGASHRPP